MATVEQAFERWWKLNRERIQTEELLARWVRDSTTADGFLDGPVKQLCWQAFRDCALWQVKLI